MNLNNKYFKIIDNSDHGLVNHHTIFSFFETNKIITADYSGGGIIHGHIIGIRDSSHQITINYQCITDDFLLKSGKANVRLNKNNKGLIEMNLDWEWHDNNEKKGQSHYIEISKPTAII